MSRHLDKKDVKSSPVRKLAVSLARMKYLSFLLALVLLNSCDITRTMTIYNNSQEDKRIEINTNRHLLRDSVRIQSAQTNHIWTYTLTNLDTLHNSFCFTLKAGHKSQISKSFGFTIDLVNYILIDNSDTVYVKDKITDNVKLKHGDYRIYLSE